ncbi:MAG: oligosaccharide flippase family protein, partial [Oscillospiraceae bacterium]
MQKKSIFKNTIYKFILSTFNIIIPLVVKPYIHGLLDKQQFGTYNKALSIVSFFMILGSFGIYNFGVREISKVKEDKEKTANLFTNLFIFGTITNVISIALFILYVFLFVNNTQQSIFYVMIIQLFGNAFYIEWINEA